MKKLNKQGGHPFKVFFIAFGALILCFFCSTCKQQPTIKIAGSTTVLPIASRAAEVYMEANPGMNVIVNAGGSGVGIKMVGEQKVDIGMASRNITQTEREKYKEADFVLHTIGKDAVVPVVSSEIYQAGIQALHLSEIASIYKGEISNWKGVGGPNKKILVVDKEKTRGTRHVFMSKVLGDERAEAPGADLVLGSNNEEQTAIVQSDAAIGMLSNAWLNKEVRGLSIILEDSAKVKPSLQNIRSGRFPITRDLFFITNGTPKGLTKKFIQFLKSSRGQKIVEEAGYVKVHS